MTEDLHPGLLWGVLGALIVISGFFSAAEIGLMTASRYRMRILADRGNRAARLALKLLERPDRLLGVILLGNNFANIAASAVATVLGLHYFGEPGIAAMAGALTFVILVFAEVAPKTVAALYPERVAFPCVWLLRPLLWLLYPLVFFVNLIANFSLRLVGIKVTRGTSREISSEELRALVREADVLIPESHQDMLLAILDLERMTVDDVMVPRPQISGLDLDGDWTDLVDELTASPYSRLPAWRGSLDGLVGMVELRPTLAVMQDERLTPESLRHLIVEPRFIPAGTTLTAQLLHFRRARYRAGFVVDEYGDILGLVTLSDILEEIVGDIVARRGPHAATAQAQEDGTYVVRGATSLREINRDLDWDLPTDHARTLNGLILDTLETIPEADTSVKIGNYQMEILRTRGHVVETVRIRRV